MSQMNKGRRALLKGGLLGLSYPMMTGVAAGLGVETAINVSISPALAAAEKKIRWKPYDPEGHVPRLVERKSSDLS